MPANGTILSSPADFWWAVLTSPLSITLGVWCIVLLLVGVAGMRGLVRLGRPGILQDRNMDGTATIEFALLLPILLFVILTLTQTTLLMGGNLFVHYAAFAATRTVIVQLPAENEDESANEYTQDKHDAIFRSAVFALLPVAGRIEEGNPAGIPTAPIVEGFERFYEGYSRTPPPWIENLLPGRLAYAAAHTRIRVLQPVVEGSDKVVFEPIELGATIEAKAPITVLVEHQLNLSVPYANRIFDDGAVGDGPTRFRNVSTRATLTNEGVLDTMPPLPRLPRIPQRLP